MSREIKFRGMRTDGKGWLIGDLYHVNGRTFIRPKVEPDVSESPDACEVNPETVGQFTGLKDKNGKEIWEGDTVLARSERVGVVEFDGGIFGVNWDYGTAQKTMLGGWGNETNLRNMNDGFSRHLEVNGNIHEQ